MNSVEVDQQVLVVGLHVAAEEAFELFRLPAREPSSTQISNQKKRNISVEMTQKSIKIKKIQSNLWPTSQNHLKTENNRLYFY